MPIFITHTMNVFGERQHPEKFIPLLYKNIHEEKKSLYIVMDPKKFRSRHYIHAEDVADGTFF